MEKYNVNDADVALECHQKTARGKRTYYMPAKKMGVSKSGKIKLLIFGDKFWGNYNIKKIRYVEPERVKDVNLSRKSL